MRSIILKLLPLRSGKMGQLCALEAAYVCGLQAGLQAIQRLPAADWRMQQQAAKRAAQSVGLPSEFARVAGYRAAAVFKRTAPLDVAVREIGVGAKAYRLVRSRRGRWVLIISTLHPRATLKIPLRVPPEYRDIVSAFRTRACHGDAVVWRHANHWYINLPVNPAGLIVDNPPNGYLGARVGSAERAAGTR